MSKCHQQCDTVTYQFVRNEFKSFSLWQSHFDLSSRVVEWIYLDFLNQNTLHLIIKWITRCYFHSHFGYILVYFPRLPIILKISMMNATKFCTRAHTETMANYICHKFLIMWLHTRAPHIVWLGSFFIEPPSFSHYTIPNQPFFTDVFIIRVHKSTETKEYISNHFA